MQGGVRLYGERVKGWYGDAVAEKPRIPLQQERDRYERTPGNMSMRVVEGR